MFQESVCLIRIAEVGRGADHILNYSREGSQHGTRSVTGSIVGFYCNVVPVNGGKLVGKPRLLFLGLDGVGLFPSLLILLAFCHDGFQFLLALSVEFLHLIIDDESVIGISAQVAHRVFVSALA